ncbi:MAG: peptide chain release factor N(5)-glutamine methyltransferase [Candidatus Eremiobacteraeota bacterium]|nr:peptide chain release factor N(5)-glutamine methyltransferase [Candidatus Eremiobacteraeota bacterium]
MLGRLTAWPIASIPPWSHPIATISDALAGAARRLRVTSDSPDADARLLLAHILSRARLDFLTHGDAPLAEEDAARFASLLDQRARGIPVAYLTGEAWFFGRRFEVTSDVLVPRPETENVVEAVLDELRGRSSRGALEVVDAGTGSGAIAVTLALEMPALCVRGTDISHAALAVAAGNARVHQVAERCRFLQGDLLLPLANGPKADCIVANLPYVPTAAIPKPPSGVAFEPAVAVDGGRDGLALYRRFLQQVPAVAAAGACLFLEAAPPTIDALASLVEETLPEAHVEIVEDYAGLDRFLSIAL